MKSIFFLVVTILLSGCIVGKYIVYPPVEYGSLEGFKNHKPKIILSPFIAVQLKDGNYRHSSQYYPQNYISFCIYERIKNNCEIVYPDSNAGYFNDTISVAYHSIKSMMNDFSQVILANPDSIQNWKCSTKIEDVDSATYFYIPFLLENMNNDDYNPKFYTILVNNQGEVIYAQMIHKYFKPGMWAKDWHHFAGDTRDIMPLSDSGF